jgi:hypothetical protein
MKIHIEFDGCDLLFEAINAAPFSDAFKASFIDEILTTPGLRFGGAGIQGLFDGRDMTTGETGDLLVHARLSRTGEAMAAAIRALTVSSGEKRCHLDTPLYQGCGSKVTPLALVQQETSHD